MIQRDTSLGGAAKDFAKTAWDLLAKARDGAADVRREGLGELCRVYWKPIYSHLRLGWAKDNEEAKDLTQAFLLWLVEGDALARYAPERASFRTYLKSLLRHFVQNHDEALGRLKRGGGVHHVALQFDPAEADAILKNRAGADPKDIFDVVWKMDLVRRAVDQVGEQFRARGQGVWFKVFEEYDGIHAPGKPTYASLAERFGVKEGDIKNYLFAVREALRSEIRSELGKIAREPGDLEEEWNAFFRS